MDYAYRVFRGVKTFYNTINPATLSGAIDVVVVEQPDGTLKSTPFHVRFGKYGVFSHSDKFVDITVNGKEIDLKMKLADSGVAYFVEEAAESVPPYLIDSPLPENNQSRPDVDTILSESARKLEDDLNDGTRRRHSAGTLKSDKSNEEQSLSQVQKKSNALYSPSVFSTRRNRSLPDLRVFQGNPDVSEDDIKTMDDCHLVDKKRRPRRRPLHHSKSQAFDKKKNNGVTFAGPTTDELLRGFYDSNKIGIPRRKKSSRASQPILIKTEESDSDHDSSVSSSTASSPSPSLLDAHGVHADSIADGALSDSEVDRHYKSPELQNQVTDWQWGQLPETSKPTKGWNWFGWGASGQPKANGAKREEGISLDELMTQNDPSKVEKYLGKSASISVDSGHASQGFSQPSSPGSNYTSETFADTVTPTQETINILPIDETQSSPGGRDRSPQLSISSADDLLIAYEEEQQPVRAEGGKLFMRSLRLSSDKLKSLGLLRGANECRFSITTKFQGTSWCICNVYLFKWHEQIVISDIDGTITKSDVLGHVIPAIGGTWAHTGVAELYSRIKNNGYKLVYLSSRAIGQSHTTKQYLRSVDQDSRQLPDGPVLLSPTSVLLAFRREVIERKPEEFKIAALSDLKKLFPCANPFFAGFGNRETDVISYRAVDIPSARILIIDPSGRVRRSDSMGYVSSYSSMATETVDYLFPPVSKRASLMIPKHQYGGWSGNSPLHHSTFTHWNGSSNGELVISDEELAEYEKKRKETRNSSSKKK